MINLKKSFKGKETQLAVKNSDFAGYVNSEGEIVLNMRDGNDFRKPLYQLTISGPSLRKLIGHGMYALDTITGYEHTMQVKVK